MTEREALKLALEALEKLKGEIYEEIYVNGLTEVLDKPITAIKEALAQPEQEPVAWISPKELLVMRGNAYAGAKDWRVNLGLEPEEGDVGLYTIPPQRTWVNATTWRGLTRTELIRCGVLPFGMSYQLYEAIEAKLKAKNSL